MNQSINSEIKLGKRKILVKNLLLIEGIGRVGKFLMSNILHGFQGIEPAQSCGILDNIPYLYRFGLIDKTVAQEILQCEIDSHCYEMMIGRNLNIRKLDKSSIYNIPRYKKYLERCKDPDGDWAVKKFIREKLYSSFIVHDLMPNIKIYFDTFPKLKVISIHRSPVYLVYSWYKRDWGTRIVGDPRAFNLLLQENQENIPWYAGGWGKQYLKLSEMDRCIAIIEWLTRAYEKSYSGLGKYNSQILFISYEDMLNHTNKVVDKVKEFLDRRVIKSEMEIILKREKLPNLDYSESKQEKLVLIQKKASPEYFEKLLALEDEYIKKEKFFSKGKI